ncbi:MAG: hypothetical protein R2766_01055 [Saprospiraceae bacterium]
MNNGYYGLSQGLGVDHDAVGNIYNVGFYGTGNFDNNNDLLLSIRKNDDPATLLQGYIVPPGLKFGYVAKFDFTGDLVWSENISHSGDFRNVHPEDVVIGDNALFVGGLNMIAKYSLNGGSPIFSYIEDGLAITELDFVSNQLYVSGFVNGQYRSLDFFMPATGPQITRPLDFIFSIYDSNLQYLKSLNPGGGAGISDGIGISTYNDKVAICGRWTGDIFKPNFPSNELSDPILYSYSENNFFSGLYECFCPSIQKTQSMVAAMN